MQSKRLRSRLFFLKIAQSMNLCFCSGDWTEKLHSMVKSTQDADLNIGKVYVEGPVGFVGSTLKKYEYILLIGAGMGVL